MNCKACVETINKPIDNCSKCSMLQRVDKCTKRLSAKYCCLTQQAVTSHYMLSRPFWWGWSWEQLLNIHCLTKITYNESYVITGFFCLKVLSGEFYFHKPITVRIELYFCYHFIHFLLFVGQYWLRKSWLKLKPKKALKASN